MVLSKYIYDQMHLIFDSKALTREEKSFKIQSLLNTWLETEEYRRLNPEPENQIAPCLPLVE
jgi:hypothetical protein